MIISFSPDFPCFLICLTYIFASISGSLADHGFTPPPPVSCDFFLSSLRLPLLLRSLSNDFSIMVDMYSSSTTCSGEPLLARRDSEDFDWVVDIADVLGDLPFPLSFGGIFSVCDMFSPSTDG